MHYDLTRRWGAFVIERTHSDLGGCGKFEYSHFQNKQILFCFSILGYDWLNSTCNIENFILFFSQLISINLVFVLVQF